MSKDPETYFRNKNVFTNILEEEKKARFSSTSLSFKVTPQMFDQSGREAVRYQQNMPSYFRIMDDPRKRNVVHHQADGQPAKMLQVISRNQGWITVNTKNPDRKHPVEKQALGDVKKVNVLSPTWMQLQYNKPGPDPLCQVGVKHGVRKETNRTFLVEKT